MEKHILIELVKACDDAYYLESVSLDNCSCLIEECDGYTIVAFRGSDEIIDWLAINSLVMSASHSKYSEAKVHKGYLKNSIKFVLQSDLIDNLDFNKQIIFTGHSMGAALALLACLELKILYTSSDLKYCGFACPAVGNSVFNDWLLSKFPAGSVFQIRNVVDIINYAGLPLYSMSPGITTFGVNVIKPHDIGSYRKIVNRFEGIYFT